MLNFEKKQELKSLCPNNFYIYYREYYFLFKFISRDDYYVNGLWSVIDPRQLLSLSSLKIYFNRLITKKPQTVILDLVYKAEIYKINKYLHDMGKK
jgi:hypothetical protein